MPPWDSLAKSSNESDLPEVRVEFLARWLFRRLAGLNVKNNYREYILVLRCETIFFEESVMNRFLSYGLCVLFLAAPTTLKADITFDVNLSGVTEGVPGS